MMDVKERVDRAMRMDIRALGWHLTADRSRIALDVSKLRMIAECCKDEYPEYIGATQQALANIERERKENIMGYNPYASISSAPVNEHEKTSPGARRGSTPFAHSPAHAPSAANGNTDGAADKQKRPSLFGKLFGGRRSSQEIERRDRSASIATGMEDYDGPERSLSDTGQAPRSGADNSMGIDDPERSQSVGAIMETPDEQLRSKSVGDILDKPAQSEQEEILKAKLERLNTRGTVEESLENTEPISSAISRHDQYHGLARQGTKQNW